MADIVDEAFGKIQSHPEGVLQSELWKILDIDSRKCSRIVKKLIDADLVERIEFRKEGIKTFLIRAKKRAVDPSLLMAGEDLIPCVACNEECMAEECPYLLDWMYQLAMEEFKE
jgi:DNA-binding MarR family transcriptional regulator